MDFEIKKNKVSNVKKYRKDELSIALAFSKLAKNEFDELIKGIVLFGSAARKLTGTEESNTNISDVDILIILDDVNIKITKEIIEAYKIICAKTIAKVDNRIHVTTLKLTTFWDFMKNGDPVGINILRDGVALLDTGFFEPLQALLQRGKIRPTFESIWSYFNKAPKALDNSRNHLLFAVVDLYWAVVDSAHSALMSLGCIPENPSMMGDLIMEHMVKKELCSKQYVDIMVLFHSLNKEIEHRLISDIRGDEYEQYYNKANMFVTKMKHIIQNIK